MIVDLVAAFFAILFVTSIYLRKTYKYWTNKGIYQIEPTWIFGNSKSLIFGKASFGGMVESWYQNLRKRNQPFGGAYLLLKPVLVVAEPKLVKKILATDFQHFNSHAGHMDEEFDPLSGHLFNMEGSKWKNMRAKLTPTFTSGKMKMMFNTMQECTNGLNDMLEEHSTSNIPVDIKDVLSRFTTDIIGSCAFGIDCNSIKNPDTEFRIYGKLVFDGGRIQQLKSVLLQSLPLYISKMLGLKQNRNDVENFFMNVVKDTVKYREDNNIVRKDFMHLLLQLKNTGKVTDSDDFRGLNGSKLESGLNINELVAQAFIFFLAGFETSSTTMTYALYELALHQNVQDKLRKEINDVLKCHDHNVTYDSIMAMKYMDTVINETLRLHTPLPFLPRKCIKDYKIPGTTTTIEKETFVQISIQGIHKDPEYYPDPDQFDPDRFSEENKAKRPPFTFLPFGEGPRICIGLRFGMLQSKIGLVAILRNYRITLNEKTAIPMKIDVNSLIKNTEGGVWVNVSKI